MSAATESHVSGNRPLNINHFSKSDRQRQTIETGKQTRMQIDKQTRDKEEDRQTHRQTDRTDRTDRADRTDRTDRTDTTDRTDRTDQTDRDRQRQTETDRDRQRQTETDGDRRRQTETDGDRRRQTETDGDRRRQTETDRDRQRQTETDGDRRRLTETDRQSTCATACAARWVGGCNTRDRSSSLSAIRTPQASYNIIMGTFVEIICSPGVLYVDPRAICELTACALP